MMRASVISAIAIAAGFIAPVAVFAQNADIYDTATIAERDRGQFRPTGGDPRYGMTYFDKDGWFQLIMPPGGEMVAVNDKTRRFLFNGVQTVSLMILTQPAPDYVGATPADLDSIVDQMLDPSTPAGGMILSFFPSGSTVKGSRRLELMADNGARKSPRLASFDVALTTEGGTRDTIFAYLPSNRGILMMHCAGALDDCRNVIAVAVKLGKEAFTPDPAMMPE